MFICAFSKTFSSPHASQDPKDIYLVGSKVEYTCSEGFYLVGLTTLECTAAQTWSANPGVCTGEVQAIYLLRYMTLHC